MKTCKCVTQVSKSHCDLFLKSLIYYRWRLSLPKYIAIRCQKSAKLLKKFLQSQYPQNCRTIRSQFIQPCQVENVNLSLFGSENVGISDVSIRVFPRTKSVFIRFDLIQIRPSLVAASFHCHG